MRLIKVGPSGELTITKYLSEAPGPYAILSHRWAASDEDEVTFEDWKTGSWGDKPGSAKLAFCAEQARRDGLEFFWVDTCCINKSNSVELDRSIRSMFSWYQNSERCYVYLSDVEFGSTGSDTIPPPWEDALRRSEWFERGWTLQELLAPKVVEFFSRDHHRLGTRETLEQQIHEITTIPIQALRGQELSSFSVEERLRWAEKRKTTEVEDKAYCLFGIFNVFLYLMYGEGDRAFERLKKEIGITVGQINTAIQESYTTQRLAVERLSGQPMPLESCFINLCIVDHQRSDDVRRSDDTSEQLPSKFSLAARLQVETPPVSKQVSLKALFDVRNGKDGSKVQPNRVLIWGAAGMGKTTLCKKIVYDFYYNDLWRDLYDRIIWLPLRTLKLIRYEAQNLTQLIEQEFFPTRSKKNLHERILDTVIEDDRTLFLLDGLDEVSYTINLDTSIGKILNGLLGRPNIIITSRPHSTYLLDNIPPDLEIETIGFFPEQVAEYIDRVAKQTSMSDRTAFELKAFIESRPIIQNLARIPVQLDAICYVWNTKYFPKENVTMTTLYQAISQRLWAKDVLSLRKKVNGEQIDQQQIKQCTNVENFVATENEFLQELAFQGFRKEAIEFNNEDIKKLRASQGMLGDSLVCLSFLRSSDNSLEACDRTFHFIHYTFQEYFAALYFVRHWIANSALPIWDTAEFGFSANPTLSIEPEQFLRTEKYVSRYDIFWRFVPGLLRAEADLAHLHRFLRVLEEEPSDLIGLTHQRLTIHCLNELGAVSGELQHEVRRREEHYIQWVLCELGLGYSTFRSSLLSEAECSDYILEVLLENDETREAAMRELCQRPSVSSNILTTVLRFLNEVKHRRTKLLAIQILSQNCSYFREEKFHSIWHNVQDLCASDRFEVVRGLQLSRRLLQLAIDALIALLQDHDESIRFEAAFALGNQPILTSSVIETLIGLLQDNNVQVRLCALRVLRWGNNLPSPAIEALIAILQRDQDDSVRSATAESLGNQTSLSSSIIDVLITRFQQDPSEEVRSAAAYALGNQTRLSSATTEVLITCFQQDPSEKVRSNAAFALCNQTSLASSTIEVLITCFQQDPSEEVRSAAAYVLGNQTRLSSATTEVLITCFQQDPSEKVRSNAAIALCNQTSLPSSAIEALIAILQHDQDHSIRENAAEALGKQTSLPSSSVQTLIAILQRDRDHSVRCNAVKALGVQTSLSKSSIEALIAILQCDRDESVRFWTARVLCRHEDFFASIPSLDSVAVETLLESWLKSSDAMTCWLWNGNFCMDVNGNQRRLPLRSGQQASLQDTWVKARLALGLPAPIAVENGGTRKGQVGSKASSSPAVRKRKRR